MKLLRYQFAMLVVFNGMLVAQGIWAEDLVMGEYEGTYQADESQTTKATAKVIAEGPAYYRVVLQAEPLTPGEPTAQFEIYGVRQGNSVNLFGRANAAYWHGRITDDKLLTFEWDLLKNWIRRTRLPAWNARRYRAKPLVSQPNDGPSGLRGPKALTPVAVAALGIPAHPGSSVTPSLSSFPSVQFLQLAPWT